VKHDTLSILCSPATHEPLRLASQPGPDGTLQETLVGVHSGVQFPIRDGVPVFVSESALSGLNKRYQGFYNKVARFYDPALGFLGFLAGGGEAKYRQEYLRELEIEEGDKVLEVSVGTGANLRLLPTGARLYGVDISWGMLTQCQRHLRKWRLQAELLLGNAEELPFQDDVFDAVLHVGGINAFNDRAKAMAEMVRVARPGTKVVIADETAHLMQRMRWMPGIEKLLSEFGDRFSAPTALVPPGVEQVQAREFAKQMFYCLTFRKP